MGPAGAGHEQCNVLVVAFFDVYLNYTSANAEKAQGAKNVMTSQGAVMNGF